MHFDQAHLATLLELLRWRRDVRQFRTDPLEEEHLRVLESAMGLAPSVGNSCPWRVVRVRDRELRRRLGEHHLAEKRRAGQQYRGEVAERYDALKLAGLWEAPEHLAVFTDLEPEAGLGLGRQTMPETLHYSTVLAIHGLWLAARALDLGVGWVSILDPQRVRAWLDVPAAWQLTAYLCVGHPAAHDDVPELQRRGWQRRAPVPWQER